VALDPRTIRLTTKSPALTVTALRGDAGPVVAGGFGGWQTVPRPRRQALTVWQGRDPFSMTVPLLFDGFKAKRFVDTDVSRLERMALPPVEGKEPPVVTIACAVPHADLPWVIAELELGDSVWAAGGRLRQAVTVHLLRYMAPDRIRDGSAASRARENAGGGGSRKVAFVAQGDSLTSIAARDLGDYSRWPEIAALNGIRDPDRLTVGQTVRLP
jgi:hypothetical protein